MLLMLADEAQLVDRRRSTIAINGSGAGFWRSLWFIAVG
jgi:hypothetical protein